MEVISAKKEGEGAMRVSDGESDTVKWVRKSFPEVELIILRSKGIYVAVVNR